MRVNYHTGQTDSHALEDDAGRQAWEEVQADPTRQASIRALVLECGPQRVAVQAPRQFRQVAFAAGLESDAGQPIGQRVEVHADDVRLVVTVLESGMVRVLLTRPGKARHLMQFARRSP